MTPNDPSLPTTDPALERLGRYQLLRLLGAGGMGQVYLAQDEQLGRRVAVKVLPAGRINDAEAVARFGREARALAQLAHPGIVQAFDSGQHDGRHFLVMEHVEGRSLAEVLREGRLPPTRAADFAHQAALALQHAHERGLIHRDVKPSNLFVTPHGQVKLLDLGLARFLQDQAGDADATREGVGMGTPDYTAPEQLRDAHRADPRADVYSLGCTLYHLLAGRVPFPTSSLREKAEAHERHVPTPLEELCLEAPGGLVLVVERMMAKRPADRFATAGEAAEALAPFVAGSSASFQTLRSTGSWHLGQLTLTRLPWHRRWWSVAGVAAALLLMAVGAGLAVWLMPNRVAEPGEGGALAKRSESPPGPLPAKPGKGKAKEEKPKAAPGPPDDPDVLTVAQSGQAKYRTIGAALEAVKPGQTVRVVDGAVYRETLVLSRNAQHAGLRLEAPQGATLEATDGVNCLVLLKDVRGVRVRGFRLSSAAAGNNYLVGVAGECGDLHLEDLRLEGTGKSVGVTVAGPTELSASSPPVITVRNCTFHRLVIGAMLQGGLVAGPVYARDTPVRGALLTDNTFTECMWGIKARGQIERVLIVANHMRRAKESGVDLEHIAAASQQVLVANNTFEECNYAVRSFDDQPRCAEVRLFNNLILGSGSQDLRAENNGGKVTSSEGPGDGPAFAAKWQMACNWREVKEPKNKAGWIPPSARDVRRDRIDDVVRVDGGVRPKPGSDLATKGAGMFDPSLPRYVGALPLEGAEAWDYARTWHAPLPGRLITVSKRKEDKADHTTLGDALREARPWTTIRVLDDGVYREALILNRNAQFEGVCLEATHRARLEPEVGQLVVLMLQDVTRVSVRGFRFRATANGKAHFVGLVGACREITLEDLQFDGTGSESTAGVTVSGPTQHSRSSAPVLTARNCTFHRLDIGAWLHGVRHEGERYGDDTPIRGILLTGNVFTSCRWGVKGRGHLEHLLIVGNHFIGATETGVGLEQISADCKQVLVANNTFEKCLYAMASWDQRPRSTEVRLFNNLVLASGNQDLHAADSGGSTQSVKGPGDGPAFAAKWQMGHNWREVKVPENKDGWVPPSATDVRRDRIDDVVRTDGEVRPKPGSDLATKGAGTFDPTLPKWVGALPPEGTPRWDWSRTWRWRAPRMAQPAEEKKKP